MGKRGSSFLSVVRFSLVSILGRQAAGCGTVSYYECGVVGVARLRLPDIRERFSRGGKRGRQHSIANSFAIPSSFSREEFSMREIDVHMFLNLARYTGFFSTITEESVRMFLVY